MSEFAELVGEDIEAFSRDRSMPMPIRLFYAYENGELQGYFIARINQPFEFCDTCPGNCISGNGLWVDKRFRNQGVFKSLYNYALEQIGAEVVYSMGHGGEQGVPYLLKYQIRLTPDASPQALDNAERLVQIKIALGHMDKIRSLTGLT